MRLKKSTGNMYDWVTHMWSPIVGCSHQCTYCYVRKNHELPKVPVLLDENFPQLGKGNIIFVGHLCDMFCAGARDEDIRCVLDCCKNFDNEYVFQSKNTERMSKWVVAMPEKALVGVTIETNRADLVAEISKAPPPAERMDHFCAIVGVRRFITVEPVLDFDPEELARMIWKAQPEFVNIGADSKGHGLKEPSKERLAAFISLLGDAKVPIRKKINLGRILGT